MTDEDTWAKELEGRGTGLRGSPGRPAATTERATIRRLNRRFADDGQVIGISRTGDPARYLLRNLHNGNIEAWADTLDDWAREMESEP